MRPLEQTLARGAGPRADELDGVGGLSNVRLNFAWGTDLNEAADEVRTRVDRVRGRLPQEADPPSIQKFDASAAPIMGIGVEGDYDRVTLREMAENDLVPRLERVEGVASVTVNGGLRRQIHVELSKEKITALDLSVDRVISVLRTENQNVPLGEVDEGDATLPAPQPGPVPEPRTDPRPRHADEGRRADLPARHRRGQRHDRRSALVPAHQRQARRAHAGREAVGQEHGRDCRRRRAPKSSASTATCPTSI